MDLLKEPLMILFLIVVVLMVIVAAVLLSQGPASPVCGDGVCDVSESCSACPGDCGTCPVAPVPEPVAVAPPELEVPEAPEVEEQVKNIFEDSIGIETENELKKEGFVLVRYFQNPGCPICTTPLNWGDMLTDIANEMKDVVVLEIFDSRTNKWAKENWGSTALGAVQDPVIRIEGYQDGQHAYRLYHGITLSNMDDPKTELASAICEYTEKC